MRLFGFIGIPELVLVLLVFSVTCAPLIAVAVYFAVRGGRDAGRRRPDGRPLPPDELIEDGCDDVPHPPEGRR